MCAVQVASWLLYARGPGSLMVEQLRYNMRRFYDTPHKISSFNVWDPNYFVWMQMAACLNGRSADFHREFERIPPLPGGDAKPVTFQRNQYCLKMVHLTDDLQRRIQIGPFFKLSHKQWMCRRGAQPKKKGTHYLNVSIFDYFLQGATLKNTSD